MHSADLKYQARILRIRGYSLNEISKQLNIAKSTVSRWVIDILLGPVAQERIRTRGETGRRKSYTTSQLKRKRLYGAINNVVEDDLDEVIVDTRTARLLCAFLYWGEGGKTSPSVRFTNSDPILVKTFLALFRKGFQVDESKFGATVHLHDYHDEEERLQFWSKVTKIPKHKIGVYHKPHTGINKRLGYPGCIAINYYDVKLFKALVAYYTNFAKKLGA